MDVIRVDVSQLGILLYKWESPLHCRRSWRRLCKTLWRKDFLGIRIYVYYICHLGYLGKRCWNNFIRSCSLFSVGMSSTYAPRKTDWGYEHIFSPNHQENNDGMVKIKLLSTVKEKICQACLIYFVNYKCINTLSTILYTIFKICINLLNTLFCFLS